MMSRSRIAVRLTLIAALLMPVPISAGGPTAGALDPSFDYDGIVITRIGAPSHASGVAIQPDGRIVAAGATDRAEVGSVFAVTRYLADGGLDPSFDGDGIALTGFGRDGDVALDVAVQPDGKIVAAGTSIARTGPAEFALARYNPDGSLDPSFGDQGRAITPLPDGEGRARALWVQPDGRIVVAGWFEHLPSSQFVVVRYNSDGSLDSSFDEDGVVLAPIDPDRPRRGHDVVVQPDGNIVVVGEAYTGTETGYDFALVRYLPDGRLDPGFGTSGEVITAFPPDGDSSTPDDDSGRAVALSPDGRLVVAGRVERGIYKEDVGVARYLPDGTLDTGFSEDAMVVTAVTAKFDSGEDVGIQGDGKIVVAGYGCPEICNFALVRYHPDGTLDSAFGTNGTVLTSPSAGESFASALQIQSDGKLVVAGASADKSSLRHVTLARYLPEPVTSLPRSQGYWIFEANGGVHARGDARFYGSASGLVPSGVVDADSTSTSGGYWIVESNGGVHARGDAHFYGSAFGLVPSGAVGFAAHPDDCGYWIVESNGGVHARGCARFFGSAFGLVPSGVVAIAATPTGNGYWIFESNGGVHARGDADFLGSAFGVVPSGVVGADNAGSGGYWIAEANGGIHARGDVGFFGSAFGVVPSGVVGVSGTPDNLGYQIAEANGGVHVRGNAQFLGSVFGVTASPVTDIEGRGG